MSPQPPHHPAGQLLAAPLACVLVTPVCQPSLCCFGCDSALGPVFLLLEESSDGDSGASEVDTGSELSDGSDGEDEEGSLEGGSGESASV